ncbi:sodium:alanine symporter family protein [Kroppenstedtia pulmonis]|uniref:Sodium:alanine symporter family protein n=1 Tax=Kroppenstedtia pulmonis TaxID=1380685 RepID=A0A7D4CPP8_9BACL|nr:sodium:alanine symporter family protein [Kroppenstedtia pulmonis]QKG85478.1 sodium:alanine symporter family protein [Kroppenstedtia pulmonis]
MKQFSEALNWMAGIIWGPWLLVIIVGTGIYFTIGTRFLQLRKFPFMVRETLGKAMQKESEIKGEGTLTPRQAVSTALASTIGVGNIVGTTTALVMGGPGAIFWMWASAFFGMCTKYAEIVLSIHFREKKKDGNFVGGPAWYMKKGLKSPFLAAVFIICLSLACIGGNMVQSNAISESVGEFFGLKPITVGLILFILVGIVSIGGVKMLGKLTEVLVPFMAGIYIVGGIIVVLVNFKELPQAVSSIFVGAFSSTSLGGGLAGFAVMEAIRYGVARGLYSNEAGQGTAPIAHATAKTDHPARQGMWGVMEVFVSTFVVCTITALAVMTSGVLSPDSSPAVLASLAFGTVFPVFKYVVGISLILFAFSTIIALNYYGETLSGYIVGEKWGKMYRYLFLPFTFIGAVGGLQLVWGIVDVLIGIAVIPNLLAILLLSPIVFRLTNQFFNGQATINHKN